MSAIKDMVASECGTSNALVRATQHLVKDHAYQHEGLSHPGNCNIYFKNFSVIFS